MRRLVVVSLILAATACADGASAARLRVTNSGAAVEDLVVVFPSDEIDFGDVAAGATTEYRDVPHGVFRQAAFRTTVDGRERTQNVKCWVGEKPLAGAAFTYVIDVDASRTEQAVVRVESVTRDE